MRHAAIGVVAVSQQSTSTHHFLTEPAQLVHISPPSTAGRVDCRSTSPQSCPLSRRHRRRRPIRPPRRSLGAISLPAVCELNNRPSAWRPCPRCCGQSARLTRSSSSLYLFTFLITIVVLALISGGLLLRAYYVRRQFQRRVEEAIRAGLPLPADASAALGIRTGGPNNRKKEKKHGPMPGIWEAEMHRQGEKWEAGLSEKADWEDIVVSLVPVVSASQKDTHVSLYRSHTKHLLLTLPRQSTLPRSCRNGEDLGFCGPSFPLACPTSRPMPPNIHRLAYNGQSRA